MDSGLVTQRLPDGSGYTYTYASRLGDILALAEEKYGERDRSYTLLGFEFIDGIPQIWYPRPERKNIIIQLTQACLTETMRGYYQLAHECVHLLSPTGGRRANILEEGLATYFSAWYMRDHLKMTGWDDSGIPSYRVAQGFTEMLLDLDPNVIKVLRAEQPIISEITADLIVKHYPTFPESVAQKLCQPFDRDLKP